MKMNEIHITKIIALAIRGIIFVVNAALTIYNIFLLSTSEVSISFSLIFPAVLNYIGVLLYLIFIIKSITIGILISSIS